MRFQEAMSGKLAALVGLWIGQHMPRSVGYGVSRFFAGAVVRFKPGVYWTVRGNLCQVLGREADDETIRQVFYHAGQTYYEFFHAIGQPPSVCRQAVHIPSATRDLIHSEMAARRGVLLLGLHTINFDVALLALGAHGLPAQILSLAAPQAGFDLLDDLRRGEGLEMTAISSQSLRAAIRRLRDGGMVITGCDRPVPGERTLVEFFGRPAYLPVGLARLALMTRATVLVGACVYDPKQGYTLDIRGPVEMVDTGNRQDDALASMRRLAVVMEGYVRARPEQWLMLHPVWPEALSKEEAI
jgi:KDO2-lipid IV(A) lauroyltransferase